MLQVGIKPKVCVFRATLSVDLIAQLRASTQPTRLWQRDWDKGNVNYITPSLAEQHQASTQRNIVANSLNSSFVNDGSSYQCSRMHFTFINSKTDRFNNVFLK